ncbi:ATP-binding protein [Massilia alkalitolerans]|uniref:ATP-binding protein n=1 Tax=Massilia alkalitolerans TaxID=286638 RepID=UPI00040D20E1|nr:ATP-binding protein [Massilia alkalitolerans]
MLLENWLPIGFVLPGGASCGRVLHGGADWQIIATDHGTALLAAASLAQRWHAAGIVTDEQIKTATFGDAEYGVIECANDAVLAPLSRCRTPDSQKEALALARALQLTRACDLTVSLHDALYVAQIERLLPAYGLDFQDDRLVLGRWLSGGVGINVASIDRLCGLSSWLRPKDVEEIIEAAGLTASGETRRLHRSTDVGIDAQGHEQDIEEGTALNSGSMSRSASKYATPFVLAGRPRLAAFFNEHIIDIVANKERYRLLGIDSPSALILHGPPGCGKTFAVEELVKYLDWPCFEIDASSVASPYIHETSRKVAEVFDKAVNSAPSVLVIDEMEAFLADRAAAGSSSHHRVEEVAEFLRRIPEAIKNGVLIIGMTNRPDMIDPAVLRRGRFDHIIEVDYASAEEVEGLLLHLLEPLPKDETVNPVALASSLARRPLSDVTFVVREGARLAARAGKNYLRQQHLLDALELCPSRVEASGERKIGFT